jgi:predicted HTH transcriptional regulator
VSGKTSGKTSGKIIKLIKENSYITIPEMALIIGVSNRSIERNLQKLQNNNKIKRVGPAKGGYWKIIDNKQL